MENYKNIYLNEKGKALEYKPPGTGTIKSSIPFRSSRKKHGEKIRRLFEKAWKERQDDLLRSNAISVTDTYGTYIEVKGEIGYDLITKSLEHVSQGIRLINVRQKEDKDKKEIYATVFIPNGKHDFLIKKIEKYVSKDSGTDVIATISDIKKAVASSLWTSDESLLPVKDNVWCEVWLRFEEGKDNHIEIVSQFRELCVSEEIEIKNQSIYFPERVVVGIFANIDSLSRLLLCCSNLAEYRIMKSPTSFFTGLTAIEQNEWIEELLTRIDTSKRKNTSICVLDTGVNNGHPLLVDFISNSDLHTYNPAWGVDDRHGHGTWMSGIAVYNNLEQCLSTNETIEINHIVESSKILNYSGTGNPRELYGDITWQAVNHAEIQNPEYNRSICMAVTAEPDSVERQGAPSTWSGAIDAMICGVDDNSGNQKRLMFVSAGNTTIDMILESGNFYDAIINHSVEDPGQSWNCITVGAYTEMDVINDPIIAESYEPVVRKGSISPFSSSSLSWNKIWPIKPEVLFEGGNLLQGIADRNFYSPHDDLSLITTAHDFYNRPLVPMAMTSAATAQAAYMAANIQHHYPDLWPETIRALMIHSATWTDEMKQFVGISGCANRTAMRELIRTCGYGVPDINKAIWSTSNSVNMIIEDKLQPYAKKGSNNVTLNEMHMHTLPLPKELLLDMGETPIKIKLTLSYYIEPGPGRIGWKDKYRYPSCGLLFDINNPYEDEATFIRRISKAMRDDEDNNKKYKNNSERWEIGSQNRNVGSIHSDIWSSTASELSNSNKIIIYPVTGWWKMRTHLKRYNDEIRYSLIVSVESPEVETDLYQAIQIEINNNIPIKTEITSI